MTDTKYLVTPEARLAFGHLWTPAPKVKGGTDLAYQATLLLPPHADLAPLKQAIAECAREKFGASVDLASLRLPLKACDRENARRQQNGKKPLKGYESGWHLLRTISKYQPTVVDQQKQPILEEDRVRNGFWICASVNFFAWTHPASGSGVSCGLNAVQLRRIDEEFGGGGSAAVAAFEAIDTGAAPTGGDDDGDDGFGGIF